MPASTSNFFLSLSVCVQKRQKKDHTQQIFSPPRTICSLKKKMDKEKIDRLGTEKRPSFCSFLKGLILPNTFLSLQQTQPLRSSSSVKTQRLSSPSQKCDAPPTSHFEPHAVSSSSSSPRNSTQYTHPQQAHNRVDQIFHQRITLTPLSFFRQRPSNLFSDSNGDDFKNFEMGLTTCYDGDDNIQCNIRSSTPFSIQPVFNDDDSKTR